MVAGRSIGPRGDIIWCWGFYMFLFAFFILTRLLWMCVSQVMMELGQHLLELWPMPPAVFPMSRSQQQSLHSSSERLCCSVENISSVSSCFVCLYLGKGGTNFGKTPIKPRGGPYFGGINGGGGDILFFPGGGGFMCRVPHVQEVWFLVLLPARRARRWDGSEALAAGTPCWHWRVGSRRLYIVTRRAVQDWSTRRTPVRRFVHAPFNCPALRADE